MSRAAIKKVEIAGQLSLIPDDKLHAVWTYMRTILKDVETPAQSRRSLRGIWKGKGFERIADLTAELAQERTQAHASASASMHCAPSLRTLLTKVLTG